MKKLLIALALPALILAASCGKSEKSEDTVKTVDLSQQYKEATNFNDSLLLLMGDVYAGLDSINIQEGLLYATGGENVDRRAEIRANLENIKARLAANRQLLDEMEKKLSSSQQQTKAQAAAIAQLKATIDSQEKKIAALEADLTKTRQQLEAAHTEINHLNDQVTETQEQVKVEAAAKEEAQNAAVEADNAANRVYYCLGTSKELKDHGIIEKKFLGKTKVMEGNYDASYFKSADRRTLTVIDTHSKKCKIKTGQPSDSYQIIENANGTKSIKITNPSKFWNKSLYLIIEI